MPHGIAQGTPIVCKDTAAIKLSLLLRYPQIKFSEFKGTEGAFVLKRANAFPPPSTVPGDMVLTGLLPNREQAAIFIFQKDCYRAVIFIPVLEYTRILRDLSLDRPV